MNRRELEALDRDALYWLARERGLREAPGLPREQVIERLLARGDEAPPPGYGVDECGLLVRDPWHLFVWWELTATGLDEARRQLGDEAGVARLVLRLFAVAPPGERGPERESHDQELDAEQGSRQLASPRPGVKVRAAVGLVTPSGLFVPVAESGALQVPPSEVAARLADEWIELAPESGTADERWAPRVLRRERGGERGVVATGRAKSDRLRRSLEGSPSSPFGPFEPEPEVEPEVEPPASSESASSKSLPNEHPGGRPGDQAAHRWRPGSQS